MGDGIWGWRGRRSVGQDGTWWYWRWVAKGGLCWRRSLTEHRTWSRVTENRIRWRKWKKWWWWAVWLAMAEPR
jgi:hypothetical protein